MRGKDFVHDKFLHVFRITPAYAGKSPYTAAQRRSDRGSPPPMRGKAGYLLATSDRGGITPAYAGKRALANAATNSTRDHPRLCGEKASASRGSTSEPGSPPPMRGKD